MASAGRAAPDPVAPDEPAPAEGVEPAELPVLADPGVVPVVAPLLVPVLPPVIEPPAGLART